MDEQTKILFIQPNSFLSVPTNFGFDMQNPLEVVAIPISTSRQRCSRTEMYLEFIFRLIIE